MKDIQENDDFANTKYNEIGKHNMNRKRREKKNQKYNILPTNGNHDQIPLWKL